MPCICFRTGDIETIEWLLHQDFSTECKDENGNTPFISASKRGHLRVLQFLKKVNADTMATNVVGNNALHEACLGAEDFEKVKWLLEQGFRIETPNPDGKSAFYLALMKGHTSLIRHFLQLKPGLLNKTSENG